MRPLSPGDTAALNRVATAQEATRNFELQCIIRQERSIRTELDYMLCEGNSQVGIADARAAERWRLWVRERRVALQRDLALVMARKDAVAMALARASAKKQAIEQLVSMNAAEARRRADARYLEKLLNDQIRCSEERAFKALGERYL